MPKKHTGNVKSYNPKFLHCRGMRQHSFRFVTDQKIVTKTVRKVLVVIEFTRVLSCRDCEVPATEKYVRRTNGKGFDRDGARQIHYEDGYLLEHPEDGPRIDQYEMRDELLERELQQAMSNRAHLRAV